MRCSPCHVSCDSRFRARRIEMIAMPTSSTVPTVAETSHGMAKTSRIAEASDMPCDSAQASRRLMHGAAPA